MTTVTLTTSQTWNAPAGVTSVQVECWGAGGGGSPGSGTGAGGGGGEYAMEPACTVVPGNGYTVTVGAGGSGAGGATSFSGAGTTTVTAHGGAQGGAGGSGSGNATHHSGGAGGTASGLGGAGGGGSGGTSAAGNNGANNAGSGSAAGATAVTGGGPGGTGAASGGNGSAPASGPGGGGGGGSFSTGAGGSGFSGQVTLTYTASTVHSGTATLSGTGTLTATGAFAGTAALSGTGTLTWSGSRIYKATVLSGSGTLTGTRHGNVAAAATLAGAGTLGVTAGGTFFRAAALTGSGSLTIPGFRLGVALTLTGTGTLTIIGTGGTVQASAGTSSPYAHPGTSQVAVAPPGTQAWQYLGTLGLVTSLTYSFTCPGGADKLTCTVMLPATYRTQLLNPGWQVRVTRGGHVVWTGRTDEPVPSAAGWQVTAVGDGNRGTDFRAVYSSTWPAGEPDQAISNAIARGMPWVNPGVGAPSGIWLGQAQDSGSGTITDLLNLACTRGGLTWYVNSQPGGPPGAGLSVFPLPTAVNRLLVCTQPVPRTLGGDINTIFLRYQISDAASGGGTQTATFGTTSVQNAASVAAHGVTETYVDLSSAGVMSAGAAQTVGNYVLSVYQRASFAGPFTVSYGQLLNAGGSPVDPGADQAGTVVRLILTDFGFGGEVTPQPITFIVGAYEWNDFTQQATVTAYQSLNTSLPGLLSLEGTVLTPVTVQQ